MDWLSTVRKAITSWPTRASISAIFVASNVPARILGRADSGMRPNAAQASQARTSIRSQSSNLCCSDQTARMAGGEYRSIKDGRIISAIGLIKILLPAISETQDVVPMVASGPLLSDWLDNRGLPMRLARNHTPGRPV